MRPLVLAALWLLRVFPLAYLVQVIFISLFHCIVFTFPSIRFPSFNSQELVLVVAWKRNFREKMGLCGV